MESECSLPHSQDPVTAPYPEPGTASSHPVSHRSILILYSYLYIGLLSGLFPSGFLTKIIKTYYRYKYNYSCVQF